MRAAFAPPDPPGERTHQTWWTAECELGRSAWHEAHTSYQEARRLDPDAPATATLLLQARAVRLQYKHAQKAARAAFERHASIDLCESFFNNPRSFYKAFKGPAAAPSASPSLDAHTAHFALLGGTPAPVAPAQKLWTDRIPSCHYFASGVLSAAERNDDAALRRCHGAALARARTAGVAGALSISAADVELFLDRLPSSRAYGVDRLPAECFKLARAPPNPDHPGAPRPHFLSSLCAALFQHIVRHDDYPSTWCTTTLTPLFKGKGPPTDPNNYRGIAVMCSLAKAYASLLESKLSTYLERHRLRSACQSGFRPGLGTQDALFIVRHLQAKHCDNRVRPPPPPVFACFVDFSKAFDKMRRDHLWSRLDTLGLEGELLAALQAMYKVVKMRVKVSGRLGAAFDSLLGVKQGDPLSPVLFGAFIEMLPEFMQTFASLDPSAWGFLEDAPTLRGFALFHLLFADDLTLLASTPQALSRMLHLLQAFCDSLDMAVNIDKTHVVVFGPTAARCRTYSFWYKGTRLEVLDSTKYLGMHLAGDGTASCMTDAVCAAATRARFAAQHRILRMKYLPPEYQIRLYTTFVRPVLTYGCQVWGADLLHLPREQPVPPARPRYDFTPDSPHEAVQIRFCRFVTGTGRTAPNWCLLHECSLDSIHVFVAGCVLRFWNSLRKPSRASHASAHAAQADIDLMIAGNTTCWTSKVCRFLAHLGRLTGFNAIDAAHRAPFESSSAPFPPDSPAYFWALSLEPDKLVFHLSGHWHERLCVAVAGDPRRCLRLPKFDTYVTWMGLKQPLDKWLPHMRLNLPRETHVCLMRFRLGCWLMLMVNAGRTARPPIPRAARLCAHPPCTRARKVEDERHVLIDCPCYDHIRASFPSLPFHDRDMRTLMTCPDQTALADLLYRIYWHRITLS
jgi:hypothetical protein